MQAMQAMLLSLDYRTEEERGPLERLRIIGAMLQLS
jgi:hypothetical protein